MGGMGLRGGAIRMLTYTKSISRMVPRNGLSRCTRSLRIGIFLASASQSNLRFRCHQMRLVLVLSGMMFQGRGRGRLGTILELLVWVRLRGVSVRSVWGFGGRRGGRVTEVG